MYFCQIKDIKWRFWGTKLSWSVLNRLWIYQITLLIKNRISHFKKQLHLECFLVLVWESCAFFSCDPLQPPFSSVGMTNNAVEGGTMRGPQRALSPQHRCILAQGSPVVKGGGWEWRQGEGGLKWFVTWFCGRLGFFINLFPSWGLGVRCRRFEQRSDWFSSAFFSVLKGCVTGQFSQRENYEGFTADWLMEFTQHPV